MMKVGEIIRHLELKAPSQTAEGWDNVGLLAGDPDWKTEGAVLCVDLTSQAIRTARENGYKLIVNHHPCIFPRSGGLGRVVAGEHGTGSLVFEAIRNGIAVAAYHTNFDRCALEVPEMITRGLGLTPKGRLIDKGRGSLLKLVVFVPLGHVEQVREAICLAGAGVIGNYDTCTFSTGGEGTFRGSDASQPFLGKPGVLEAAKELRLETILPRGLEKTVLQAMRAAHPYEEVAYDLYPVEQAPGLQGMTRGVGYGFWGDYSKPKAFQDVARDVKRLFKVDGFWISEPVPAKVKRVGFVAGKGASFTDAAAAAGCDLFITGEAGYHVVLEASRRGVAVMELGHRESEFFFPRAMKGWLSEIGLKSKELNLPTQRIRC